MQGIEVDYHGGLVKFHAYLIAFIGDTPAAGLVGRFKEGVGSAFRGCRICMTNINQLRLKVSAFVITI